MQQNTGPEKELFAALRKAASMSREASLAFLREIIAAGEFGEAAVQIRFSEMARALGAEVSEHRYQPAAVPLREEFAGGAVLAEGERRAVLARFKGRGGGRSLILFAHPDSEKISGFERWLHKPFAGEAVDGKIHGWGVADDLAGVAIMIEAMRVLDAAGIVLQGDVILASTPSKRHARGVSALLHSGLSADAAVYLHPAESGAGMGEIKALTCGEIEFRLVIAGKPAPTTEPLQTGFAHLAVNAADKAMAIAEALRQLDQERAARLSHPALQKAVGRSTNFMVSHIAAGEPGKPARVPERCEIGCAVSFPPGERLAEVKAEIEAAIATAVSGDPWLRGNPPAVHWDSGTGSAEVPADHPLYAAVAASLTAMAGKAPFFNPMHTGSDIRNPILQKGIPTVGMGPLCGALSQNGGHDEWVDLEDFFRAVAAAAAIAAEWCGTASRLSSQNG